MWPIIRSFALALVLTCAAIWQLGCDGVVAGFKIGPQKCGLQVGRVREVKMIEGSVR